MLSACFLLVATICTLASAASIYSIDGYCMHEGEKFYPGEKVVLQQCQYTCQCNVTEGYSFFMCEPVCKLPFDVMCADGEEPEVEMEDSSVPECKCPRYYCPERLSVANLIDYGIDDGYFDPDWDLETDDRDDYVNLDDSRYLE